MTGEILVIAPYPPIGAPIEGWYSRIRTIDSLFAEFERTYVWFADHHAGQDDPQVQLLPRVRQLNLSPKEPHHRVIFDEAFDRARLVYCHTVHLAIDILPWISSGKLVIDIHGIAPEEEALNGNTDRELIFSAVERQVLAEARSLVVVSSAMERHLRDKYPDTKANFVVVPIIEQYGNRSDNGRHSEDWEEARVIFAGSAQVWQNVDSMLYLAAHCQSFADTLILSHDTAAFLKRAAELGVPADSFAIASAKKHEVPSYYQERDFGLILRDDIAVNRVSCPTKLSEYMDFGIIPVVRSPSLGDFADEGYRYVTEEEFRSAYLPDRRTQAHMRAANRAAIRRIATKFHVGSARIKAMLDK
jgi:hypothetical protein